MMETPDCWVVLKINSPKYGEIYKVLCGWYGGYCGSDSWKMNSGITKCEYDENYWYFHGYSGSIYKCHKNSERMSGLMGSIFHSLRLQLEELNDGSYIKVVKSYSGVENNV